MSFAAPTKSSLSRKVASKEKTTAPGKSAKQTRPQKKSFAPPPPLPVFEDDVPSEEQSSASEEEDVADMMSEDEAKVAQPTKNVNRPRGNALYGKERRSKNVKTQPSAVPKDDPFSAELLFLETVKDGGFHRTVGSSDNYFSLNLYLMFEYIHQAFVLMNNNPKVEKYFKWFNPAAFSAYISFLVHIQIVRAQVAVHRVQRTADSKFVRAFLRDFPEESLVIPGFLVPFFNQIAGVILDDPKFGNLAPRMPAGFTINNFANDTNRHATFAPFSSLAILASRFASNNIYKVANINAYFIANTVGPAAADTTYLGVNWDTTAHASSTRIQRYYRRPGMNYGFDFSEINNETPVANNSPKYEHSVTKRRALAQRFEPLITKVDALTGAEVMTTCADLLLCDEGHAWFRCLLTHAVEFCKFFQGTSNLSKIDTTTGLSRSFEGQASNFPTGNLWTTPATDLEAPGRYAQFTARYYSIRGECSDLDIKKAMMTAISVIGPSNTRGNTFAAGDVYTGRFFDATTEQAAEVVTDSFDPTSLIPSLLQNKQYITNPYA
jgi:hypothetical protein